MSKDDADDLFQEVALRFCQNADMLHDEVRLLPWLQTVLFHCSCNHYRDKNRVRMIPFSALYETAADYDASEKKEYVVEDTSADMEHLMRGFYRLMDGFDSFEKMVVELSLVGGVNVRELSKMLRVSKATVIRIRACAIDKLREKMMSRRASIKVMTGRSATLRDIIEFAG